MHRVTLLRNQSLYTLPVGETRPYFSFDKLARRVSEAHVSDNSAVRHTSVANKWKTIHLLLHSGHNATQIQYNLTLQREDDTEFTMSFIVALDTRVVPQANVSKPAKKDASTEPTPTPTPEPVFPFSDIPEDKQGPKVQKKQPGDSVIEVPAMNVSLLPAAVRSELQKLEEKLLIGDITLKGYNLTKAEILKNYRAQQQVSDSHPGKARSKPYKDLEGDHSEGKQPLGDETGKSNKENMTSKDKLSKKDALAQKKPATAPPHVDVEQTKDIETPKRYNLNAAIERPIISKLLSGISKTKSAENQAEPANAAGKGPVGRRLQHFTSSDRGFLPWERRKYFQELLEVRHIWYKLPLFYLFFDFPINLLMCDISPGGGASAKRTIV